MTLDEMMRLAEDQARRVLIGTKEELMPSWLMVDGVGKVQIFATPWRNTEEKHLTVEAMRLIMRQSQAQAYSLLTEAWMATVTGEEAKRPYEGPPPSERPDRTEAVVVMAANRAGEHRYHTLRIVRGKKGVCDALERLDGSEDMFSSTLFDNLLQDKERAN